MRMHQLVAIMVLATMTQAVHEEVCSLFGCLYVYGFLLALPDYRDFASGISYFVQHHFLILCAEKCDAFVINLKITDFNGGGALTWGIKRGLAKDLYSAALVVGMKMGLRAAECVAAVSQVMYNNDFADPKLLLMAASDLKIRWLENEVMRRVDAGDARVGLYVLLRKYLFDHSEETAAAVDGIIATRPYTNMHNDFRLVCLEARDDMRTYDIVQLQVRFRIVNEQNFMCFVNEELLFVLEVLDASEFLRVRIRAEWLADSHVRILLRVGSWSIVREIAIPVIKRSLLEVVRCEKDKVFAMRALDLCILMNMLVDDMTKVLDAADPTMKQFLVTTLSCDAESVGLFLNAHPEYVDKASLVWIVRRASHDVLKVFLERMRAVGGVEMVLDVTTSTHLLKLVRDENLGTLVPTGVKLTLRSVSDFYITSPVTNTALLHHAQIHIPRYDVELIGFISECGKRPLLARLYSEVENTSVLDRYVEMVAASESTHLRETLD